MHAEHAGLELGLDMANGLIVLEQHTSRMQHGIARCQPI